MRWILSLIVVCLLTAMFPLQFVTRISAGALSQSKITISDSRAAQSGVTHEFAFTTATTDTVASVVFEYCTTASGSCLIPSGISTTGASQLSVSGLGTSTSTFTSNGTITLSVTTPTQIASSTAILVSYGSITNPSSPNTSYFVRVSTKNGSAQTIDSTVVPFATLGTTSIAVSAEVGLTFTFSIAAVTSGSVNGATINTAATTADSLPFGLLTSGSPKIAAHDMTVSTNAPHGYKITVASTNPPLTSNTDNIDNFTGTNATPTTWSAPAGNSPNVNTGFLGYTTNDSTLSTGNIDRFTSSGGNKWAGLSVTPEEVAYNSSGVISGETTRVGWQIEVNTLQPAGTYSGTIIAVATPTY